VRYKHKKSGKVYEKVTDAIDCTNSRGGHESGRVMTIYVQPDVLSVYVRDKEEFDENFEVIDD
jgi:hypothetical protein